jgi:hypothetical protein
MKKLFLIVFAFTVGAIAEIGKAFVEVGKILQSKTFLDFGNLPYHNRVSRRADGWIPRLVGVRMLNARPGAGNRLGLPNYIQGHRLLNANGDIDVTSTGFKYAIDNLSYIAADVIKQKLYKIPVADFMTVDVGENPWSSEMIRNITFQNGGDFYEGDVNQGQGGQRTASVDVSLGKVRMANQIWAKATNWTIFEIAQAAATSKWDIVSDKLEALKTNWDLGIQRTGFLGHKQITTITGLLNSADVTINTSLLPTTLSKMTSAQLATFIGTALATYFSNSNSTEAQPNRLVLPMSDYLGLLQPFASGFPVNSRLEYLENAFKAACGPDFQIKGLAYGQAAQNTDAGIAKQRAVLYKDDPEVLKFSIPVDFTLLEAASYNKINWEQDAYGQYSGVLVTRPREILYMDVQTS